MHPAQWTEVAARAMWAGNYPTDHNTEASGELSIWCLRNRQTNLDAAPYRLRLERTDGDTVEVPASRADLLHRAYSVLAAALGGALQALAMIGAARRFEPRLVIRSTA